jgi:hypothetical protein
LDEAAAAGKVDLKPAAGDTNDPLRLSAFGRLGEDSMFATAAACRI